MLKNYLAAALRNLARNKLYAGINIFGLAIGFAAALLIAAFVRAELSYDQFIPEHESAYLLTYVVSMPGYTIPKMNRMPAELAEPLRLEFPDFQAVARLAGRLQTLRRGDYAATEQIYWADTDFFTVISLPVAFGDLATALSDPNGIVLTRRIARKYFGRDDVVGETLELSDSKETHVMRVKAVLQDLPSNTHLDTEIIAPGIASFSRLSELDANPDSSDSWEGSSYMYVKMPDASAYERVVRELSTFAAKHKPLDKAARVKLIPSLAPLSAIHLHAVDAMFMKPPGERSTIYGMSIIGLLIVFIALVNFTNLTTVQAMGRSIEVGVRKASGAARRDLILQFIGEVWLCIVLATTISLALVELAQPVFNAALQTAIDLWRDPMLVLGAFLVTPLFAIAAAAYPAFVLSALRPLTTLRRHTAVSGGSIALRQALVAAQFAVLIGLVFAAVVIYRQTAYASTEAVNLQTDQVLLVQNTDCNSAFKDLVKSTPGVAAVACSRGAPTNHFRANYFAHLPNGSKFIVERVVVDADFFALYGLSPLAGRSFSNSRMSDMLGAHQTVMQAPVVINEAALRRFGFKSPEAAVGQFVTVEAVRDQAAPSEIIGVVADFATDSVRNAVNPSVFYVEPAQFDLMSIKLLGRNISAALPAIDALINKATKPDRRVFRVFFNQYLQDLYSDIERNARVLTAFTAMALLVACLGLFGLSAFSAKRRTKEIGIRKAVGADTADVMRLLVWDFTKPVLWANLIAWPVAGLIMHRWLRGFAYHIELAPWFFVAAAGPALAIAVLTVSVHCYLVARAKPVTALRYE